MLKEHARRLNRNQWVIAIRLMEINKRTSWKEKSKRLDIDIITLNYATN